MHHTTVRISTRMIKDSTSFFGSVVRVFTNSAVLVSLYFLKCQVSIGEKRVPNSSNLTKRAEGSPPRAGSRTKTFPEKPKIFRVSCGNPESRLGMVLGLGIVEGWLGTWVAPELLAVSGS